jgi:DNA-binding transcriptional regulator LsrR (DeoR family)
MGTGHATYLSQHVPGANVVAICEPHAEASSALVDDLSPDERPLVQFVSALGA